MRSVSVVLPESMWAEIPMLRTLARLLMANNPSQNHFALKNKWEFCWARSEKTLQEGMQNSAATSGPNYPSVRTPKRLKGKRSTRKLAAMLGQGPRDRQRFR